MTSEGLFEWIEQNCCCCNSGTFKQIGYRGGDAHVSGKGFKCSIVSCANCGHIYPRPMPVLIDTNRVYNNPEEYFVSNDPDEHLTNYSLLLQKLDKKLGRKGKLLDVGSGRGELLYVAQKMGWAAEGVETSTEFTNYSISKYNVAVRNCSLESAEFSSEKFDVVTLGAVIEHLYHPEVILKEINRILKPGGILWIDAPNESSLYNIVGNLYFKMQSRDWVTHLSPTFPPYHVQGFTLNSMKTLLANTGYEIESIDTFDKKFLLPKTSIKQCVEYYGTMLISTVSNIINRGTFMNVFATKVSHVSSVNRSSSN